MSNIITYNTLISASEKGKQPSRALAKCEGGEASGGVWELDVGDGPRLQVLNSTQQAVQKRACIRRVNVSHTRSLKSPAATLCHSVAVQTLCSTHTRSLL